MSWFFRVTRPVYPRSSRSHPDSTGYRTEAITSFEGALAPAAFTTRTRR